MNNNQNKWCPFAMCLLVNGDGEDEGGEVLKNISSYNRISFSEGGVTRMPFAAECIKSECAMWKPGKYQFTGSCGAIK